MRRVLVAAVLAASVLAGCGGGQTDEEKIAEKTQEKVRAEIANELTVIRCSVDDAEVESYECIVEDDLTGERREVYVATGPDGADGPVFVFDFNAAD